MGKGGGGKQPRSVTILQQGPPRSMGGPSVDESPPQAKIFFGLFICSYASFRDFNDEIINILKQYFCNRV